MLTHYTAYICLLTAYLSQPSKALVSNAHWPSAGPRPPPLLGSLVVTSFWPGTASQDLGCCLPSRTSRIRRPGQGSSRALDVLSDCHTPQPHPTAEPRRPVRRTRHKMMRGRGGLGRRVVSERHDSWCIFSYHARPSLPSPHPGQLLRMKRADQGCRLSWLACHASNCGTPQDAWPAKLMISSTRAGLGQGLGWDRVGLFLFLRSLIARHHRSSGRPIPPFPSPLTCAPPPSHHRRACLPGPNRRRPRNPACPSHQYAVTQPCSVRIVRQVAWSPPLTPAPHRSSNVGAPSRLHSNDTTGIRSLRLNPIVHPLLGSLLCNYRPSGLVNPRALEHSCRPRACCPGR